MNTRTLKAKLIPALALALLMVVPMLIATVPIVKASSNTPVLGVVLSGTTSNTLIPAQSVGTTFSVDVRVDNTSSVSPGINSYSYGLTWNPAVLNVTNVNDAFSGSFLNSGANLGTVQSLGDLPVNNTKGLLTIGDIILNTSDFAACATGSGVLTTVTFKVLATGQSNINLQPSDTGVAYLTYPDSQGNSHDVVATTINAAYLPLTVLSTEVGISGYKLMFNDTMNNSFGPLATINYQWSVVIDKWNGATWVATTINASSPLVVGYAIPASTVANLPCYVYRLNSSGQNALAWGNWLKMSFTFHWTYGGNSYSTATWRS
jgi:hypothetical protein